MLFRSSQLPLDWDPGGSWDPSDGMLDDGTPISIPPGERPGNDIIGLEAYLWSNDRRYWRITGGSAMPDYGGRQLFPKQASKWAHYLKDVPIGEWSPGPQRMNYPDRGNVTFQQYGFTVVDPWGDQSSRSSNTWSAANRYQYGITPDLQDYQLGCWGEDAMPSADDFWIKKFNEKHSYESNE